MTRTDYQSIRYDSVGVHIASHNSSRIKPCRKCNHKFKPGEAYVHGSQGRGIAKNFCLGCLTDARGTPIYRDPRIRGVVSWKP